MANFPPATHDLFNFDQLLSEEEKDVKYRTRAYMVKPFQLNLTGVTSK